MREHLNTEAREVMSMAEKEALAVGHGWVGTEHLLLGLLHSVEEKRSGSERLARLLMLPSLERARRRVTELLPPEPEGGAGREVIPTPRVGLVLDHAARVGAASVAPEHLLLGLLWEVEGIGARILAESGLFYGDAADALSIPVSDLPNLPDDAPLGPKVDVSVEDLEVLLEKLPGIVPPGCPLAFNIGEGGRAWIALGEGVDVEAHVREALAR